MISSRQAPSNGPRRWRRLPACRRQAQSWKCGAAESKWKHPGSARRAAEQGGRV